MSKLVSMMAMACLGILIVRVGLVSTEDSRAFSALTVYVLQPALIFSSFHLELTAQRRNGFFAAVAVSMLKLLLKQAEDTFHRNSSFLKSRKK